MSSPTSPRSWTVVVFEATIDDESESVQAVPTKWIEGELCAWPVLPIEKLNMAIRKCHFSSSWPKHKIRTLRNATFSDYTMARNKAKKAELTSDLDTDEDTIKRKRIRKIITYSSDSEVEEEEKFKQKKVFQIPLPPKPSPKPTENSLFNKGDGGAALDIVDVFNATPFQHKGDDNIMDKYLTTPRGLQGGESRHNQSEGASSTYVKQVEKIKESEHCKNCHQNIYIMRNLLLEVNSKLDKLMLQTPMNKDKEAEDADVMTKCGLDFPIKTEEDMRKLEEFLENKKNYLLMVGYLSKFGGLNLGEFLRRSLQSVIGDDLALLYSFKGRKQKEQFEKLAICKAVIEAAEKAKLSNNKKETENAIGGWLRRAQERKRRAGLKN